MDRAVWRLRFQHAESRSVSEALLNLRISVVTAVFNRVDTVAEALASVHAQTWPSVEQVVIDGASSDGSAELLHSMRDQFSVYVSERDGGIYDALNKGVGRCTGDVIGFLHADDLLADEMALSRVAAAFADPSIDAVYGDLVYVQKDDPTKVVRYWQSGGFDRSRLAWGWMPPHPTVYMRRSLYERMGGFDTSYRIAADYDHMLRVLSSGIGVAYIPHVQLRMRVGGASNRSLRNIMRKSTEDYRALRGNDVGGIGALAWKNLSKIPQFFKRLG